MTRLSLYGSQSSRISRLTRSGLVALRSQLRSRQQQYRRSYAQAQTAMRSYRDEVNRLAGEISTVDKSLAETKAMQSQLSSAILQSQARLSTRYTEYAATSRNVVIGLKGYISKRLSKASSANSGLEKFIRAIESHKRSLEEKKRTAQANYEREGAYCSLCQTSISRISSDLQRIERRLNTL